MEYNFSSLLAEKNPNLWDTRYLEERLDEIMANRSGSDIEEIGVLSNILQERDPYNDLFHINCPNWPHCEEKGCSSNYSEEYMMHPFLPSS